MNKEKIIYGINTIIKIIKQNPTIISKIYILKINKKTNYLIKESKKLNIQIIYIKHIKNEKLTYIRKYNSTICKIYNIISQDFDLTKLIANKDKSAILILDRIQDPYNFAACIRTAEAFSVKTIITNERNCTKNSSLLSKISNGSSILTNIITHDNISKIIEFLKSNNVKIIGLSTKTTKHVNELNLTPPIAIVMGSEKNGITKSLAKLCTHICKIPLFEKSKSINVSVATGIILSKITY